MGALSPRLGNAKAMNDHAIFSLRARRAPQATYSTFICVVTLLSTHMERKGTERRFRGEGCRLAPVETRRVRFEKRHGDGMLGCKGILGRGFDVEDVAV